MVRTTVVADFEAFFSRPVAPTRRIAVGELRFPRAATGRDESARVAAASMLLGGVVASFAPGLDEDDTSELHRLIDTLHLQSSPVLMVTNEVGSGIVPDNRLARDFRDAAGTLNQQVAAMADEVYLAVCGLPMKVK